MVVLVHAVIQTGASGAGWARPFGHLGFAVPLLFMVSGFVLYRPYCAARWAGAPRVDARQFARKRILRILPPYWLALTLLAIYPGLEGVFGAHWWLFYGLGQVYTQDTALEGLGVAWTLNVELAFYVGLPLYALLAQRVVSGASPRGGMRRDLLLLGALGAGSLAFLATFEPSGGHAHLALTPVANLDWLALGMGLAVISVGWEAGWRPSALEMVASRPALAWAGAAVGFAALLSLPDLPTKEEFPPPFPRGVAVAEHGLKGVIALLLFVPAVLDQHDGGAPRRLMALRLPAAAGVVSYGIYLWHQTILEWLIDQGAMTWVTGAPFLLVFLLTLAMSVVVAVASYVAIERPLLRLKFRRRALGKETPTHEGGAARGRRVRQPR